MQVIFFIAIIFSDKKNKNVMQMKNLTKATRFFFHCTFANLALENFNSSAFFLRMNENDDKKLFQKIASKENL